MRKPQKTLPGVTRRQVLTWTGAALAALTPGTGQSQAVTLTGATPGWRPFADNPPQTYSSQGWLFFTEAEAATLEAIVDRLIPEDDLSPGGKACGCAVFIDRQLHGFYGNFERLYREGPFREGHAGNRAISPPLTPRERYRPRVCQAWIIMSVSSITKRFHELNGDEQDNVLRGAGKKGAITLDGIDGTLFFCPGAKQTPPKAFFADPIYGGQTAIWCPWKNDWFFPAQRYGLPRFHRAP
jgi:gluconate 2-dehydrogenase gamma chain